jgi:hypothetical protein
MNNKNLNKAYLTLNVSLFQSNINEIKKDKSCDCLKHVKKGFIIFKQFQK